MKFAHTFDESTRCEVEVPEISPGDPIPKLDFQWEGEPQAKHTHEYVEWVNGINQRLCDRANKAYGFVFKFPRAAGGWQCWFYQPGKPPRRDALELN